MISIKFQLKIIGYSICIFLSALSFTGCKKLFGLKLQENTEHETTTIDPHIIKLRGSF